MSKARCCYDSPRDFSAIRQRIAEKYEHEYQFAEKLGLSKHQFSKKMRSLSPFTVDEICNICELLGIEDADIDSCFRTPLVVVEGPKGLRTVIKEKFGNEANLARVLGMQKNKFCHRLNFKTEFRYSELVAMARELGLSLDSVAELLEIERRKRDGKKA